MTESQRTTPEQEKARNTDLDPIVKNSDMQRPTPASPIGVYDQAAMATTTTTASSRNMMWIILLIVLVIVAFFILRQWM